MVVANLCNTNKTPPRLRGGGFKNTVFEDGGVESLTLLREPPPLHFVSLVPLEEGQFFISVCSCFLVTPSFVNLA